MIYSIVYSVHFFALAKINPSTETMAPEPNILQEEMPFSKVNMMKSFSKSTEKQVR